MSPRMSIQTLFVALLAGQTLVVGGLVAWLSAAQGREATEQMAVALAAEVSLRVHGQIDGVLDRARLANELTAAAILHGDVPVDHHTPALERLLWRHLSQFDVRMSYVASVTGHYTAAANNSRFGRLVTVQEKPGGPATRYAADPWGVRGELLAVVHQGYVPQERPWYLLAMDAPGTVWTDVYADSTLGLREVTTATPIRDEDGVLRGIVGSDIVLDSLSDFLETLEIGPHGETVILDARDRVVASSSPQRGGALVPVQEADNTVIAAMGREVLGKHLESGTWSLDLAGEAFFVQVTPFVGAERPAWRTVVAIPRAFYMAPIDAGFRLALALCAGAVLLITLVGGAVARRITQPLADVAVALQRASRLVLDETTPAESRLAEVHRMQQAVGTLTQGLRAFEKYVPADLVRQLLAAHHDAALGVDSCDLTVFFSDLEGFTELAESLPQDVLVELVGAYLGAISTEVLEHEGTVDKFIGDAVMAFWNAPEVVEDHVALACEAALSAQARIAALQVEWRARGLPAPAARIGLHVGAALVGNIGSSKRMDYTVIGDTVNLAARLEDLNKVYGTYTLVSAAVARRAGSHFVFRPLGRVVAKGRSQPTAVFELIGTVDTVPAARVAELDQFGRALTAWQEGRPEDALRDLADLDDGPAHWLRRQCEASGDNDPMS